MGSPNGLDAVTECSQVTVQRLDYLGIERVMGERVMGERVMGERVMGERVMGERVMGERVMGGG